LAEQASEAAAIPTQSHFHFHFLLLLLLAPPLFPHTKSNHAATLNTNYAELQRLKKQQLLPKNHHHHHHHNQSNTHVFETCRREEEEEEGWDRVLSFRADVDLVCT
jgi:hypothetical protein